MRQTFSFDAFQRNRHKTHKQPLAKVTSLAQASIFPNKNSLSQANETLKVLEKSTFIIEPTHFISIHCNLTRPAAPPLASHAPLVLPGHHATLCTASSSRGNREFARAGCRSTILPRKIPCWLPICAADFTTSVSSSLARPARRAQQERHLSHAALQRTLVRWDW